MLTKRIPRQWRTKFLGQILLFSFLSLYTKITVSHAQPRPILSMLSPCIQNTSHYFNIVLGEGDWLETMLRSFHSSKSSVSFLLSVNILSCIPRTFLLTYSKFKCHRKFLSLLSNNPLNLRFVLCQMKQAGRILRKSWNKKKHCHKKKDEKSLKFCRSKINRRKEGFKSFSLIVVASTIVTNFIFVCTLVSWELSVG